MNFKFCEDFLIKIKFLGGETPWVIGATEYASEICHRQPWYIYCNPDDILIKTVERSKRVIENPKIHKINVTMGNQAITGLPECNVLLF